MSDAGENIGCAVAILDIGSVNDGSDEQALRVGDDMALSTLDLLARIITPCFAEP